MDEQREAEEARNIANNEETIRNAADVAIATKVPHAVAAGAAIKAADKLTQGKSTELLGKGLNEANKNSVLGPALQSATNKINESGIGDKAGKVARTYNGRNGAGSDLAKEPTGTNMDTIGRGRDEPSSSLNSAQVPNKNSEEKPPRIAGIGPFGKQPGDINNEDSNDPQDNKEKENPYSILGKRERKILIGIFLPFIGFIFIIIFMFLALSYLYTGSFDDALGAGEAAGEDLGVASSYDGASKDAQEYYERINNVKLTFQSQGKTFDAIDIAAVFHVLMDNGANLEYKTISEGKITEVANAMFDGNIYDKDHFKEELKSKIIPKYFPKKTDDEIADIADQIDQYLSDYYDYIERSIESSAAYNQCGAIGNCTYDIKGFSINNKNISKSMQIDNLKVRLMQCGKPYGNGNDNTPINQDLISFENYVGGVAYAELGDGESIEAYKAQMVMARSFALSRPTAMNNSKGKKLTQENGKWILQISSCVSDQVFCNMDKGCSYMGGGDGQGGWVASGTNVAGAERTRGPLKANSNLRKALAATQGEVLTNNQGFIISTNFNSTAQKNLSNYAKSGLDYKQILFKMYPNAKNIDKMTCNGSTNCTISAGEYSNWKQCGATWSSTPMGNSGKNICGIGCLVTSVSMLIAKSGVQTNIPNFNPGSFVEYLNSNKGFAAGGNFLWNAATGVAPTFKYQGKISLSGLSKEQKLSKISQAVSSGEYLACEVKGNTGQHWVAIDGISGDQIIMMDPGSNSNNMWQKYNWANTSQCASYKVG